jgi:hypothetical protein
MILEIKLSKPMSKDCVGIMPIIIRDALAGNGITHIITLHTLQTYKDLKHLKLSKILLFFIKIVINIIIII